MPAVTKLRELHVDRLVVAGETVGGGKPDAPPPAVLDSEATKIADLRRDLNALLAALREAGVIR